MRLGNPQKSLHRILQKDLRLEAYKVQFIHDTHFHLLGFSTYLLKVRESEGLRQHLESIQDLNDEIRKANDDIGQPF